MQIYALFATVLISGLVLPQSATSPILATHNCRIGADNWSRHFIHASACTEAPPLLLSCPPGYLDSSWKTALPQTSAAASPIKAHHRPHALCGLGDGAAAQFTNSFAFAMQVSNSHCLLAKKSSNYFLLQSTSPHCCIAIAAECASVIYTLLLQAGDVETNPGLGTIEEIPTELKKNYPLVNPPFSPN